MPFRIARDGCYIRRRMLLMLKMREVDSFSKSEEEGF